MIQTPQVTGELVVRRLWSPTIGPDAAGFGARTPDAENTPPRVSEAEAEPPDEVQRDASSTTSPLPRDLAHRGALASTLRPARARQWGEDDLEQLAVNQPHRLLAILRSSDVHEADLSFAAEKAGLIDSEDVRAALLVLLEHPSSLVREGAVYGLAAREPASVAIVNALRQHASANLEASPGVREAVIDALDLMGL